MKIEEFYQELQKIQKDLIVDLEKLDKDLKVTKDHWDKKELKGGGISCYVEGPVFESGGVNISLVRSQEADQLNLPGTGSELQATGISIIIHPYSPKIPTIHGNFRWIQRGEDFWFGGGVDLTPYYPDEESFRNFHFFWSELLKEKYPAMKKQCDDYFVNHHRDKEARGIGGFFFDYEQHKPEFILSLAQNFKKSYLPLCEKHLKTSFDDLDKEFQLYRRGRYVEFNLLHDRGTLFGLKTKGRIQSIFVSLPKNCSFFYDYQPKKEEHKIMNSYYKPMPWLST